MPDDSRRAAPRVLLEQPLRAELNRVVNALALELPPSVHADASARIWNVYEQLNKNWSELFKTASEARREAEDRADAAALALQARQEPMTLERFHADVLRITKEYVDKIVVESDGYPMLHDAGAIRTLLLNAVLHGEETARKAADAALQARARELEQLSRAILPDDVKRASWDTQGLCALAEAHRVDSALVDEMAEAGETLREALMRAKDADVARTRLLAGLQQLHEDWRPEIMMADVTHDRDGARYLAVPETFFDELDALLDAWRGGIVPQPQQWQLIETAPKDGTWILIGWFELPGQSHMEVAFWHTHQGGRWCQIHSAFTRDSNWQPTHWMPLPGVPPRAEADR